MVRARSNVTSRIGLNHMRVSDLRVCNTDKPVQCARTTYEMGMDYNQAYSGYRSRRAKINGRDQRRCCRTVKYEVDGVQLCSLHAGQAALKILMNDNTHI